MDRTSPLTLRRQLRDHGTDHTRAADQRRPALRMWSAAASDGLAHHNDPGPLAIAWRDRWLLLLIAVVTGAAVYGLSMQLPPVYAAETTLAFPYTESEVALTGGEMERARTLRTEAERITAFGLLEQAARSMRTPVDTATLAERVFAIPASDADVITVRATAATASEAMVIADAVAAAYRRQVDWRAQLQIEDLEHREGTLEKRIATQEKQLAQQLGDAPVDAESDVAPGRSTPSASALRIALEASVSQLSDVQQRLDEARTRQETSAGGGVQVLQPAELPAEPEHPRPARDAATAVILALLAVTTVRWWRADPEPPRLEDAQSAEVLLDAPVVGEVPYLRRPTGPAGEVTSRHPDVVDAYRMVTAATPIRGSVLVTGAQPDESCSDLVVNLGALLARDGYHVMLVEGDPHLGRLRGPDTNRHAGLTNLLADRTELGACLLVSNTDGSRPRMGLVPWGTGPAGLPRSIGPQLSAALGELAEHADVLLVDGPPLASSADALTFAGRVDSILLTVSTGTPLSDIRRLRARLDQLDRPVLGVVVQHTTSGRRLRRRRRAATRPLRWTPAQRSVSDTDPGTR